MLLWSTTSENTIGTWSVLGMHQINLHQTRNLHLVYHARAYIITFRGFCITIKFPQLEMFILPIRVWESTEVNMQLHCYRWGWEQFSIHAALFTWCDGLLWTKSNSSVLDWVAPFFSLWKVIYNAVVGCSYPYALRFFKLRPCESSKISFCITRHFTKAWEVGTYYWTECSDPVTWPRGKLAEINHSKRWQQIKIVTDNLK